MINDAGGGGEDGEGHAGIAQRSGRLAVFALARGGRVLRTVQAQAEALAALPGALVALNRSIRALAQSLDQLREMLITVERVATRADHLHDRAGRAGSCPGPRV